MNILITGGGGFIGTSLSLHLIEKGHQVTILDNFSQQIHGNNPKNTFLYKKIEGLVSIVEGDVRDKYLLSNLIKKNEVIVHLAAETGTGQSMYQIHKYTDVNINGSALILDILANENIKHVKKLVIASSRAIYGEGAYSCIEHGRIYPEPRKEVDLLKGDFNTKCPICNKTVSLCTTKEDDKVNASSIYGLTKYNQEQMFIIMGKALNIPTIALRYQNVYGPGQSLTNPYTGILSIFSTRIKNGNNINIFEDGKESRDFVYIDDVVQATTLAIENTTITNDIFNVGSGEAITVESVAKILLEQYSSSNRYIISGAYRVGDIRHNIADLSKIKSALGYIPKYLFREGIAKFVNWVNEQQIQLDHYEKSIEEMKTKGLYNEKNIT